MWEHQEDILNRVIFQDVIVLLLSTAETVIFILYKENDTQVNNHGTDVDSDTHDLPMNEKLKSRFLVLKASGIVLKATEYLYRRWWAKWHSEWVGRRCQN